VFEPRVGPLWGHRTPGRATGCSPVTHGPDIEKPPPIQGKRRIRTLSFSARECADSLERGPSVGKLAGLFICWSPYPAPLVGLWQASDPRPFSRWLPHTGHTQRLDSRSTSWYYVLVGRARCLCARPSLYPEPETVVSVTATPHRKEHDMTGKPIKYAPRKYRPRKRAESFILLHGPVSCDRCAEPIRTGQRARFGADSALHHAQHRAPSRPPETICPRCHLVRPCFC